MGVLRCDQFGESRLLRRDLDGVTGDADAVVDDLTRSGRRVGTGGGDRAAARQPGDHGPEHKGDDGG